MITLAFEVSGSVLYSCWAHTAGCPSLTRMRGLPPPMQGAAIQVPNAVLMISWVWAKVTFLEASCWIEYSTQGEPAGHAMGMPQLSPRSGVQDSPVTFLPAMTQLAVRQ